MIQKIRNLDPVYYVLYCIFIVFLKYEYFVFVNPDTPKEAHSRIFVTGGSFFVRQMVAKKNNSSFLARLQYQYCAGYKNTIYTYF